MCLGNFKFLRVIQLTTFLVGAFLSFAALAGLERPISEGGQRWRNQVSYSQFVELIQTKVQEMPELNPWRSYLGSEQIQRNQQALPQLEMSQLAQEIYFAGGALRGLIHWLTKELESKPYEEVLRNSKAPSLNSLILSGSDRDIFINLSLSEEQLPENLRQHWDVLNGEFLRESLRAGGSNIEKIGVRVTGRGIYDPRGALRDYYKGKIGFFDAAEDDFADFRSYSKDGGLNGNSKIALLLRHLRFLVQFSDAAITKTEIEKYKRIVFEEAQHVSSDNYWIDKALDKFERQCLRSGVDAKEILNEIGLLYVLGQQGYGMRRAPPELLLKRHIESLIESPKIDFIEIERIKDELENSKIMETTFVTLIESKLGLAKSPEEFLRLMEPQSLEGNPDYVAKLQKVWARNAGVFAALQPDRYQYMRARKMIRDEKTMRAFLKAVLPQMKSADQFLGFVNSNQRIYVVHENFNGRLLKEFAEPFAALKPNAYQLREAVHIAGSTEARTRLIEANMGQIKSIRQLIGLSIEVENREKAETSVRQFNRWFGDLIEKNLWLFDRFNPSFDELQLIKEWIGEDRVIEKVLRQLLPRVKTKAQLERLLTPELSDPHQEYVEMLARIREDHLRSKKIELADRVGVGPAMCHLLF